MKARKLVAVLGIMSISAVTLGGVAANAEEATGVGSTEGKVEFVQEEGDEKPVTPTEPPEITNPPEPPVPPVEAGEATLLWYPKLNFGTHKYNDAIENVYDAILTEKDQWTNFPGATHLNENGEAVDAEGNVVTGVPTFYPALVQVKNTPKATKWDLKVSLGDFIQTGSTDILPGATIKITSSSLVTGLGNAATRPATTFTLTPGQDEDGNANSTTLLNYTKPENDDVESNSYNSLLFGTVSDATTNQKPLVWDEEEDTYVPLEDKVNANDPDQKALLKYNNGVELHIPANKPVNAKGYVATLDWTLTCEF